MASLERTAYPRFGRLVSARELDESFTPSVEEIGWARAKTRSAAHLLALVVLLKAYNRLGYFTRRRTGLLIRGGLAVGCAG